MYFLLVDLADRFHLLKYGLALIFMIIGGKMLLLDIYKTPVVLALGAVGLNLASSIFASLVVAKKQTLGRRKRVVSRDVTALLTVVYSVHFATLIGSYIDVYAPDSIRPYRSVYNLIRVYKFLRAHVRFSLKKVSRMV